MSIPHNIVANADDMGRDPVVNAAILRSFELGYINSTSLITNMDGFEEAVEMIQTRPVFKNIGVHINLGEGPPLTGVNNRYLDANGHWNIDKTNQVRRTLNAAEKSQFLNEINAQIDRALSQKIPISHLDSHLHLHTLPCFCKLFLTAARQHDLKLRLAQTYNEGSLLKYYYRKYINNLAKKKGLNYTDRLETVDRFLSYYAQPGSLQQKIEIMFHPWFDNTDGLTDNYDPASFKKWIGYLESDPW